MTKKFRKLLEAMPKERQQHIEQQAKQLISTIVSIQKPIKTKQVIQNDIKTMLPVIK